MQLKRITLKQFVQSRFLPWSLVAILVTAGFFGTGAYQELKTEKETWFTESLTLQKQTQTLREKVVMAELALREAKNRKVATKTTVEETRPDGTIIVTKEETDEETQTQTEKDTKKITSEKEAVQEKLEKTVEIEEKTKEVSVLATNYRLGAEISITGFTTAPSYGVVGSMRLFGPFHVRSGVSLDAITYLPERFSLGVELSF